ncbi:MAG: hypothetical protein ACE5KD_04125 [Candidatus Bathyarchaeia archaeon]
MPISKKEFENGKLYSKVEEEIVSFLNERKERAFTSQEIMGGIHYHTEFSTPEITKMSTFAIADFTALLYDLAKSGRIKMKVVRSRMYFMAAGDGAAQCPQCGLEVAKPKKTWKMAGRPDRKGKRLQLHIGLYKCPKHGVFRIVLSKKKIKAREPKRRRITKEKMLKKRIKMKRAAEEKKKKKKKLGDWPLF